MRLTGFKLYQDFQDIPAGFYPIGNYKEPDEFDFVERKNLIPSEVEQIYSGNIFATVSAVVCREYRHIEQMMSLMYNLIQYYNVFVLHKGEWNVDYDAVRECKMYFDIYDETWMVHKKGSDVKVYMTFRDSEPLEFTKEDVYIYGMARKTYTSVQGRLAIKTIHKLSEFSHEYHWSTYANYVCVLNEPKLHLHPADQRTLVKDILDNVNIGFRPVTNVNILIFTQSPFVLNDIFTHNTLYLDENCKVRRVDKETFAQDLNEIVKHNVPTGAAIGPVAKNVIRGIMYDGAANCKTLLKYIGDPAIIRSLCK